MQWIYQISRIVCEICLHYTPVVMSFCRSCVAILDACCHSGWCFDAICISPACLFFLVLDTASSYTNYLKKFVLRRCVFIIAWNPAYRDSMTMSFSLYVTIIFSAQLDWSFCPILSSIWNGWNSKPPSCKTPSFRDLTFSVCFPIDIYCFWVLTIFSA